jgi:hypothetical protein
MAMSTWRGEGILRIAPVGMPWSIWLFLELVAAVTQGRFTADVERGLSMPHPQRTRAVRSSMDVTARMRAGPAAMVLT